MLIMYYHNNFNIDFYIAMIGLHTIGRFWRINAPWRVSLSGVTSLLIYNCTRRSGALPSQDTRCRSSFSPRPDFWRQTKDDWPGRGGGPWFNKIFNCAISVQQGEYLFSRGPSVLLVREVSWPPASKIIIFIYYRWHNAIFDITTVPNRQKN